MFKFITIGLLGLLALPALAAPSVSIIIPTDGASIADDAEVKLRIGADDFLFVDYKNNSELYPGNPDAGHAVFWLDATDELTIESGEKVLSDSIINLGRLDSGAHEITVELFRNDLSRFEPPVVASTAFSVGGMDVELELDRDKYESPFLVIVFLGFAVVFFIIMRRAYRRFSRHSRGE